MSRARGATSQRWAAPVCVVGFVLRFGGSLAKNVLRRQGPGIDGLHLRAELQIPGGQILLDLRRGCHPLVELHQGLGPRLGILPDVLIRDDSHEAKLGHQVNGTSHSRPPEPTNENSYQRERKTDNTQLTL